MFPANDVPRAVTVPARDVRALQLSNGLGRSSPEHQAQLGAEALLNRLRGDINSELSNRVRPADARVRVSGR